MKSVPQGLIVLFRQAYDSPNILNGKYYMSTAL